MEVVQNPTGNSKSNGAAPPSRCHDPATTAVNFQRLVGHLHALGPRPVAELLTELVGTDEQAHRDVFHLLEKYGALDPALVRALDGSGFPVPPLHAVAEPA
jgi:hypothetical protein